MRLHFLPGDSLIEAFRQTNIGGEIAVCRECLVDGEIKADNLDGFWRVRENYLAAAYPKTPGYYNKNVRTGFDKLLNQGEGDQINLWFEYELFCQANMWFCLYLLRNSKSKIYRVSPAVRNQDDIWNGFGCLSAEDLEESFDRREEFSPADVSLGADLWKAFQDGRVEDLYRLSHTVSRCFPFLSEVCIAVKEMETRPKATLREIVESGETEFGNIFREFSRLEGVYGFGDLQVRRLYDELL